MAADRLSVGSALPNTSLSSSALRLPAAGDAASRSRRQQPAAAVGDAFQGCGESNLRLPRHPPRVPAVRRLHPHLSNPVRDRTTPPPLLPLPPPYPFPPDFSSLTSTLTSSPSLSLAAASYESIGHWLFHCQKLPQALTVLRSALSVRTAAGQRAAGWKVRVTLGRVMGAMEERAEGNREDVQRWWAALEEEVAGQDLDVETSAVYHAGHFHAKVAAAERERGGEGGDEWWVRAVEVWGRLELVPCRYRPSLRSPSTPAMQRHCQRVQQAVDQLQATAPLLSLRGLLSLQLITLRCASALLASVHLFTAAAIPLLSCALLHLHSAHLTEALACLVQAEELHQRKATATPTAQVSYQYELLLCEVRLHLRPSSPLPSLPSPLPQSSHVALRLLQCQGLSVESLLRWKEGRGEDSLAARKAECRGWTQLVHHLMGSVRKAETNSTATSGHSREASTKSQRVGSGHSRLEVERREECKEQEGAEADAAHEVQASREYDALLGSLSSVSSPHVHLILSSFLSCLRHYAGLLERCGHIRDALHYLDLALSLSDGLHAERDTLWLRMLQRRIHTKRRQPQGQPSQSDPSQPAEVREERIDTELQLEAASLAAATGEGFEVTIEGSERFAVIARYVEMADAYRRGAQQEAGCQHYRHALTLINQSLQHTSSSSGLTEGRLQLTSDATTKRVVTRRPTRSKAKKPSASRDVVADSNQPPMHPLHLYRAHIDAKIASLSLSASLPHPSPLDCLIRSSSSFAHGNEHVDHAWALYWQWRAAPFNLTRPHPWSSAALRSGETSPSSQLSLLRSAVDACCRLAPPYLTRLLFLALSSATGLTSPLDAAFALNASIGITARHAVNRTLHARPQTTDVDSLTTSLSVLHLGSNSADGQADALPARGSRQV